MSRRSRSSVASPTLTLQAHLKEARNRLFACIAVFVLFSSLAYVVYDRILWALLLPLHGQKLMYLSPAGGFSFIFTVTMWAGFALTLPLLLYNVFKFISPALPRSVRSRGVIVLFGSLLLFLTGASFGYFYAIPGALHFLVGFGNQYVTAMITADAYLNFVLLYTVGLGILFQVPIIIMLIHWITPLKPGGLLKFERYIILGAFIIGALLSPSPDALNQTMIAAPFIAMYQVGVIGVMISTARRKRTGKRQETAAPVVMGEQSARAAARVVVVQKPVDVMPAATPQPARRQTVDDVVRVRPSGVNVPLRAVPRASRPVQPRRAMDVFVPSSQNA